MDLEQHVKVVPQIVEIPGKNNIFMVYDHNRIEVVNCGRENDFGKAGAVTNNFHFDHKELSVIRCHTSNSDYIGEEMRNETALVALAYDSGTVHFFHS